MPVEKDFFGIEDTVKSLRSPVGFPVTVHRDGFSWAIAGETYAETTKITAKDWNRLLVNFRTALLNTALDRTALNVDDPDLLLKVIRAVAQEKLDAELPAAVISAAADAVEDNAELIGTYLNTTALRDRATHFGLQSISTIAELTSVTPGDGGRALLELGDVVQVDHLFGRFGSLAELAAADVPETIERVSTRSRAPVDDAPLSFKGGASFVRSSEAEIFSACFPAPAAEVLLYVPFNGPAGSTTARDLSGNARAVTAVGADISAAQTLFGHNTAYHDGVGDYWAVPDSADWAFAGDFAISCYVMCEDLAAERPLFVHPTDTNNLYWLRINTDGSIEFKQKQSGVDTISLVSAAGVITAMQWHHVMLVRDGNDFSIYVDRAEVASATDTTPIGNFASDFRIGYYAPVGSMKGWISRFEVRTGAKWEAGYVIDAGDFGGGVQTPGPFLPEPDYAHLSPRAFTQSNDGAWWKIDSDVLTIEQFGGVGDGAISYGTGPGGIDVVTGTNNIDAWRAMHEAMAVLARPARLDSGMYFMGAEPVFAAPQSLHGAGEEATYIVTSCNRYETGMRFLSRAKLYDLTLVVGAYESRGVGRADRQCGVTIGDQKFTNGDPHFVDDFEIDRVRFWAINLGNQVSHAICFMQSTRGGMIGAVSDRGSPGKFSAFELAHWGGVGEGDNVNVIRTFHNRNVTHGRVDCSRCNYGLWLSSTSGFSFKDVYTDGVKQALLFLAGDETNRLAGAAAEKIGRAMHIENFVITNLEDESTYEAVAIANLGSSTFEAYPAPDAAVGRRKDMLDVALVIEQLTIIGSPNASKKLLYLFSNRGMIQINKYVFRDVAGPAISVTNSRGLEINAEGKTTFAGSPIIFTNSDDIYGSIDIEASQTTVGDGVQIVGEMFSSTLGANAAAGATSITLSSAVPDDVPETFPVIVNGMLVRATGFAEAGPPGVTTLLIEPLPDAATSGDDVIIDLRPKSIDLWIRTKGYHEGTTVTDAVATLRGPGAERAGVNGLRVSGNSRVDWYAPAPLGNGVNIVGAPSTATCDIRVEDDSVVVTHGGKLGANATHTDYNVIIENTGTVKNNRFIGIGTEFAGAITDKISASSASHYTLIGCRDSATGAIL